MPPIMTDFDSFVFPLCFALLELSKPIFATANKTVSGRVAIETPTVLGLSLTQAGYQPAVAYHYWSH